jgi:gliding motility-associated-like protein
LVKKLYISYILIILHANFLILGQTDKIIPPPDVCPGEKGMQYGVEGYENSTFIWIVEGGEIVADDNAVDNIITVDWTESSDIIKYSLHVIEISAQNCIGDTVSVDIGFKDHSKVILLDGIETVQICPDSTLEIDAGDGFASYDWNEGESHAQKYYVTQSKTVRVDVTNDDGCTSFDEVTVRVTPRPVVELGDTIQPCNETIELDAGRFSTFRWSTGNIDQIFEIGEVDYDSLIWVDVEDFYGCKASDSVLVMRCIDAIDVPSAFTPNGDGYNDVWEIDGIDRFENAEVRVFNRKKILVFESIGLYQPWDGKAANGKLLPVDSYHYIIDLKDDELEIEQGFVTIVY